MTCEKPFSTTDRKRLIWAADYLGKRGYVGANDEIWAALEADDANTEFANLTALDDGTVPGSNVVPFRRL